MDEQAGCHDGAARQPRKLPDPCVMVIFGAEGDLTNRLLTPALYNLARTNSLPEDFALIGVSRGDISSQEWREHLHANLERFVGSHAEFSAAGLDERAWATLAAKMTYLKGDVTQAETYERLTSELQKHQARNVIFYLAVADRFFETIIEELGAAGLVREHLRGDGAPPYWRRVVIEKPFGHDLASAQLLNDRILRVLREDQIFRIDHFLGKDTVQSIMALRFANGFFEPIWNRDRIDHVQITVAETVGVEGRGNFYEATGALRDMVPNHVFSLVCDDRHGAAGRLRCDVDKKQEGRSLHGHAARKAGAGGARPIRHRRGHESTKARLSRRTSCVAHLRCRNLCRDAAGDRQLALGRGPVLHPHRQAHVAAIDRGRDLLQAGARRNLPAHARGVSQAELARARHRAQGGDLAAVRGQAARRPCRALPP